MGRMIDLHGDGALFIGYNGEYEVWIINPLAEVDVVPVVSGTWIGGELGHCSVCGHHGCASDIWDGCKNMYCPNCGARMDDETD